MNQREKMLVAAVAALVGIWILTSLYSGYAESLAKRRIELVTAQKELSDLNLETIKARLAVNKLARWREQSLPNTKPNDPDSRELAYRLYSQWLQETLRAAGINFKTVNRAQRTATLSSQEIGAIGISVDGPAELPNVVDFLHRFYSSAQMHQITKLDLKKEPNGMVMAMQVEALLLPGAANTDKLPDGKANPFTLASMDAYRTLIVERNIFDPFRRPEDRTVVQQQRPEGEVDASRLTRFTGTTHGTQGLLAWIWVMPTGDNWQAKEGETVKVGEWSTKIVTIEPRAIVIEDAEGNRGRVEAGSNLRDARMRPKRRDESASSDRGATPEAAGSL
jgi:hypothetical protein